MLDRFIKRKATFCFVYSRINRDMQRNQKAMLKENREAADDEFVFCVVWVEDFVELIWSVEWIFIVIKDSVDMSVECWELVVFCSIWIGRFLNNAWRIDDKSKYWSTRDFNSMKVSLLLHCS